MRLSSDLRPAHAGLARNAIGIWRAMNAPQRAKQAHLGASQASVISLTIWSSDRPHQPWLRHLHAQR